MAKYKRYRNYNRRNKSRWSPNITHLSDVFTLAASQTFFNSQVLAFNPVQSNQTVAQVFTVKNIELAASFESQASISTIEGLCAFIMFVPQGMTITANYDVEHPEYIMAYKYYGTPAQDGVQNFQPIRIRSRLARKLQTGDSIILYTKGYNVSGTQQSSIEFHGLVRWWTKAN